MAYSFNFAVRVAALGLSVALLPPQAANAAVVFNNGGPDTTNAYSINQTLHAQDDFLIAAGATIGSVGFYFQNFNGITGWDQNVSYRINANAAGSPALLLTFGAGLNVVASDSGLPWAAPGNAFLVTFDLQSPFTAAAGTTYWLGLTGANSGTGNDWWITSSNTGNGRSNGAQIGESLAFYLNGTANTAVPEPISLSLFGAGLLGLAAIRRRRA